MQIGYCALGRVSTGEILKAGKSKRPPLSLLPQRSLSHGSLENQTQSRNSLKNPWPLWNSLVIQESAQFVCPKPGRALVFVLAIDKAVLPLLKRILKSFSPSSEFCLAVFVFAKSNIAKPSGVSVLSLIFIRLDCRPCDRILTQDPFDFISLPALMPKFHGSLMGCRQGSKKRLQSSVIALQIRR